MYLEGTSQNVLDQVDVVVTDNDQETGTDFDTETTPIADVPPEVEIVKTANPTRIEPGESVDYTFTIFNRSTIEEIEIVSFSDEHVHVRSRRVRGHRRLPGTPTTVTTPAARIKCPAPSRGCRRPIRAGLSNFDHVNVATVVGRG